MYHFEKTEFIKDEELCKIWNLQKINICRYDEEEKEDMQLIRIKENLLATEKYGKIFCEILKSKNSISEDDFKKVFAEGELERDRYISVIENLVYYAYYGQEICRINNKLEGLEKRKDLLEMIQGGMENGTVLYFRNEIE